MMKDGKTPLQVAAYRGNLRLVQYIYRYHKEHLNVVDPVRHLVIMIMTLTVNDEYSWGEQY